MRGRVISYYAMAFFGMQPIGAVLIGALSHVIGVPNTFLVQGIITLLIALYFMPYLKQRELRQADKLKIGQLEENSAEAS
jgi:MFS family permease